MSGGDVYGPDMEDESAYDHPTLADLLGDARVAYGARTPRVGPALAEFFHAAPLPARRKPMRRALAQLAAATTAVVAATGGLAIAGALPAPVRDALPGPVRALVPGGGPEEELPLEAPGTSTTTDADDPTLPGDVATSTTTDADDADEAARTAPGDVTTTTAGTPGGQPDNHGAEVSEVARDPSLQGCERGRAVSEVASGKDKDKPCPATGTPPVSTSTSTSTSTTTTTVENGAPAPGAGGDAPGNSGSAPGNSGSAPGRNRRG